MKKTISILLAIVMIISLCPINAFAAGTVTISVGSNGQAVSAGETVSLPVTVESNTGISSAKMKVVFDTSVFELTSFSEGTISGDTVNTNVSNGMIAWLKADTADSTKTGILCYINLKVKEGVSITGEQTISITYYQDEDDFLDVNNDNVTATFNAGKVVLGPISTADYTAALSSTAPEVTKGEDVSVTVTVDGTVGVYNAAEITLSYPNILTYKGIAASGTGDEITVDSNTTGKLYIVDKGSENDKNTTYTVTFAAVATGEADVTLDNAAFGTRLASQTNSLTTADITANSVKVTVKPQTFDVTFPSDPNVTENDLFTSTQTPTEGTDFVFTSTNSNYEYSNVVVEVVDSEGNKKQIENVSENPTGTWTVPGESITGDLVVTATATPKSYGVTYSYVDVDGTTQSGDAANATYGTKYTYTMPDGVAASGATDGFHYEVDTLTIGGTASTAYQQNITEKTVTITGTAITGSVAIILKKVTDSADSWAVGVEAADDITTSEYSVASSVKKGQTISLTVIPQTGYTYKVTAKTTDDNTNVPLTQNGDVYTTTAGVTENITFVVTRAVDTGSFKWELYLEGGMGDGANPNKNMYLVKIGTKIDNKHYTIDGKNMYWSEEYGAYAYVVIADTAPTAEAFTFTIKDNAADGTYAVSYDKNVNKSADGTVDANDAQLVYDMYNREYKLVTDNVSVMKFLEADVNCNQKVDTEDAAAIVTAVLARMSGSTT